MRTRVKIRNLLVGALLAVGVTPPVPAVEPAPDPAALRLLIAENAALVAFYRDLHETAGPLNAASQWFSTVAMTGRDWDEARMHARATVHRAAPGLERLKASAAALAVTAPAQAPLYPFLPGEVGLAQQSVEALADHARRLEAQSVAAADRDREAMVRESFALEEGARALAAEEHAIALAWLDSVPVDHPDSLLGRAMVELGRPWRIEMPGIDAAPDAWAAYYRESARISRDAGRRIEALARAAALEVPAFETALAALLDAAGIAAPAALASEAGGALTGQVEATGRLGRLQGETAALLDRLAALEAGTGLDEAMGQAAQRYDDLLLAVVRQMDERYRILSEGVSR